MKRLGLLCLVAALTGSAFAQINSFTLTHNGAVYGEGNLIGAGDRSDGGTAAEFNMGSSDNLFQNWWWYRTSLMNREFALGNQVAGNFAGNHARIVYDEPNGAGGQEVVRFDFEYTLTRINVETAVLQIGWKIHNLSGREFDLAFFGYTDYDLDGSSGGDAGVFTPPNSMYVTDGPVGAGTIASSTALTHWEQGAFAGVRNKLTNAGVDDLSDSVANFGPGDWTGAYEWQFFLAPNGAPGGQDQMVGSLVKYINVVPEPATIGILSAGFLALAARRRRR